MRGWLVIGTRSLRVQLGICGVCGSNLRRMTEKSDSYLIISYVVKSLISFPAELRGDI